MTEVPTQKQTPPEPAYKVERPRPRRLSRRRQVGLGALLACASVAALWVIWPSRAGIPPVETSAAAEFLERARGPSFGPIEPVTEPGDFVGLSAIEGELAAQRTALEARNAALQGEVNRLQSELRSATARAEANQAAAAKDLDTALEMARQQNLALMADMRAEFEREIAALKSVSAGSDAAAARRETELAARRAEAAKQLAARIASPSVVFDNGQSAGIGRTGYPMPPEASSGSRDAAGRDFVQSGREAVRVEASQVIANPSNTILQGTIIDATLENAVDSSLPGQLTAIVTRPVWSFDQAQVLIPAGSRLFGDYSAEVAIGQGRLLVAWTRLVTPDGQSVQMEAFGGDAQGRSGITGRVDTRFAERFGSAALISLLAAVPAIAAVQYAEGIGSDTAESIGQDLGSATGMALEAYTTLPPVITVAPGAAITVMVDRDLELW